MSGKKKKKESPAETKIEHNNYITIFLKNNQYKNDCIFDFLVLKLLIIKALNK